MAVGVLGVPASPEPVSERADYRVERGSSAASVEPAPVGAGFVAVPVLTASVAVPVADASAAAPAEAASVV
ncbi:hypothetical protein, partial [Nocardia farcinica]|uniref:hypothetical protein n=1 Tax=Nocardia farcinica TaxID=37329 RepID=UPI001C0F1EB6